MFIFDVRDDNRLHEAIAFGKAHSDGLARCAATTLPARPATANISLVEFDVTGEQGVETLCLAHKVADWLTDAVCGLVGHPKLALEFLTAHAVTRRAEQIDRIEPRHERGARILEDGSCGGVGANRDSRGRLEGQFQNL